MSNKSKKTVSWDLPQFKVTDVIDDDEIFESFKDVASTTKGRIVTFNVLYRYMFGEGDDDHRKHIEARLYKLQERNKIVNIESTPNWLVA